MPDKNSVNIFLTTLSTFPGNRKPGSLQANYYYHGNKYCDGCYQLEPGAKLVLSNVPLDRMIILGSDKTYHPEDVFEEKLNAVTSPKPVDDYSPLTFFKYRLGLFLNNKNLRETYRQEQASIIDANRQKELYALVTATAETRKQASQTDSDWSDSTQWFFLEEQTNAFKHALSENIRAGFADRVEYEQYLKDDDVTGDEFLKSQDFLREFESGKTTEQQISDHYSGQINKLKKWTISNIRKELLLFREKQDLLQIIQKQGQTTQGMRKTIDVLRDTIIKMEKEIDTLRQNREHQEYAYIKSRLFSLISNENRITAREENKDIQTVFIPQYIKQNVSCNSAADDGNRVDNLSGIVKEILRVEQDEPEPPMINLYIDVQGGNRTDGYIRNAVLSVLSNDPGDRIRIHTVYGTNFDIRNYANEIVDETSRYKITDLVSGMNAFLKYGKADLIKDYWAKCGDGTEYYKNLVNRMVDIDHHLSICRMDLLISDIKALKNLINKHRKNNNARMSTSANSVFSIMEDGILRDYHALLETNELQIIEMVKWAYRKGFYQQALTLIEAKMPGEIIRNGILYYCTTTDISAKRKTLQTAYFRLRNKAKAQHTEEMIKDFNHYFWKYAPLNDVLWQQSRNGLTDKALSVSLKTCRIYTACNSNQKIIALHKAYNRVCEVRNNLSHWNNKDNTVKNVTNSITRFIKEYESALSYTTTPDKRIETFDCIFEDTQVFMFTLDQTSPSDNVSGTIDVKKKRISLNPFNRNICDAYDWTKIKRAGCALPIKPDRKTGYWVPCSNPEDGSDPWEAYKAQNSGQKKGKQKTK